MPSNSMPAMLQLFPLVFIMFMFYFLMIKPQQKKQKEHKMMIDGMNKNDEVVTSGGIHGTVVNIKDKTFIIRVDDNAKIEVDKNAISYIVKKRNG